MKKLLIIGASGHGRVIADIALKMNRWQEIAFLDDNPAIEESMGISVIGKVVDAIDHVEAHDIIVAIGNNTIREKIQSQLEISSASIPTLIHPMAVIGEQVRLGSGTVVMAGVTINCCSTIGKGCIINTGAILDHDCVINDFAHICPGVSLAGTVKIGKRSWIGIGSVVSNNIHICSDSIVGAGTVIVRNIDKPGTYVGVPARRL